MKMRIAVGVVALVALLGTARPSSALSVDIFDIQAGGQMLMPLGPMYELVLAQFDVHAQNVAFGDVPQSFFDVFFDVTITDVDPLKSFGGGVADGHSFNFNTTTVTVTLGPGNFYNGFSGSSYGLGVDLNGDSITDDIEINTYSIGFGPPIGSGPFLHPTVITISGGVNPPFFAPLDGPTIAPLPLLNWVEETSAVPEPGSLMLLGSGLALVAARVRRRR